MDGVLIVNKEAGFTSFDVIAVLRGILHMKRIGHGGTLDPEATGVLPVFLGKATKLCDCLPDERKVYEAEVLLGRTTDTEDIWGETLSECIPSVTEEEVRDAVRSFIGEYDQIPPMVSAKKVGGKKLYELAREGKTVERQPVRLRIDDIEILSMALPRVRIRVSCEKGTYIRTLSADIGKKLGCGACMSALCRLQAGAFSIAEAHTLAEIRAAAEDGSLEKMILPIEQVLPYPALRANAEGSRLLRNGNRLNAADLRDDFQPEGGKRYRMLDDAGLFLGVYRYDEESRMLLADKMFL